MTRLHQAAIPILIALVVSGCSESSPTAPSPTATTATATPPPVPAPVSQTLTGTWTGAGQKFTVTQNGTSATGMIAPMTTTIADGVTLTGSTMITGIVVETSVTLQMNDRMIINRLGETLSCTAGYTFTGTLSGNTLSGTMEGTTPLNCGGTLPAFRVPEVSGPVTYTRQ